MTQINYKALIEDAMLTMVKDILKKISKNGLPKNHHFLITFFSNSKGVIIPNWMKEKYPDKMTIIIRNWFENKSNKDSHTGIDFKSILVECKSHVGKEHRAKICPKRHRTNQKRDQRLSNNRKQIWL